MMAPERPLPKEDASLLLEQWRREMEAAERQQRRMQLVMQSAAGVCVLIAAANNDRFRGWLWGIIGISGICWATVTICELAARTV